MTDQPFATAEQLDARPTDKDAAIEGASAALRAWAGWHIFPSREDVLTLDGNGTPVVLMPTGHVTAVSSVVVDGTSYAPDTGYTWTRSGILTLAARPAAPRSVVVTLTHGYEDVPAELRELVLDAAAAGLALSGENAGVASESTGPFSITYARTSGALAAMTSPLINRYRVTTSPA